MTRKWWIPLAMASLVAVAGCKKPESASETQQDMAAAEAEGQQKVDEARAEAAQDINAARQEETQTTIESAGNSNPADAAANNMGAHTDTMKTEAEGRYKVESAEIEAAYKVEKERCDASTGSARDTCLNQAKTDYERKLSEAKNRRDSIRGALDGNSVARP